MCAVLERMCAVLERKEQSKSQTVVLFGREITMAIGNAIAFGTVIPTATTDYLVDGFAWRGF